MLSSNKKVLLVAQECNPNWTSVPLIAFKYCSELSKYVDLTLVTHSRNYNSLKGKEIGKIIQIKESKIESIWYKLAYYISGCRRWWPIIHILSYPLHIYFCKRVNKKFNSKIKKGEYDIVHIITPILPRYPAPLVDACKAMGIPLVIGPCNGGLEYPKSHWGVYFKEGGPLKFVANLFSHYKSVQHTYHNCSKILCGSYSTKKYIENICRHVDSKTEYMCENGIENVLSLKKIRFNIEKKLKCVYVGRLVPYKGCLFVIEAIKNLIRDGRQNIELIIIGSGPEENYYKKIVADYGLNEYITFLGWQPENVIQEYYRNFDILTFPSIREFGGAVVIEAMSNGCTPLIIERGGPFEVTTEKTAIYIKIGKKDEIILSIIKELKELMQDKSKLIDLSINGVKASKKYLWNRKIKRTIEIYNELKEAI